MQGIFIMTWLVWWQMQSHKVWSRIMHVHGMQQPGGFACMVNISNVDKLCKDMSEIQWLTQNGTKGAGMWRWLIALLLKVMVHSMENAEISGKPAGLRPTYAKSAKGIFMGVIPATVKRAILVMVALPRHETSEKQTGIRSPSATRRIPRRLQIGRRRRMLRQNQLCQALRLYWCHWVIQVRLDSRW